MTQTNVKRMVKQNSSHVNYEFCNNCGKIGHLFHQCRNPILSIGIIVFRFNHITNCREYLMICRKHTLGFVEFIRGKYPIYDEFYLNNIFMEMTQHEKMNVNHMTFSELWNSVWCGTNMHFTNDQKNASNKFSLLKQGIRTSLHHDISLTEVIQTSNRFNIWNEPEWGFPKGRRNYLENDYPCALREFEEETGYSKKKIRILQNVLPFEEIFVGSNLKCYKHKYYLGYMHFNDTLIMNNFQKSEVSSMKWLSFQECIQKIRSYNKEKMKVLKNVDDALNNFIVII